MRNVRYLLSLAVLGAIVPSVCTADSSHWRGPDQNGAFPDTGLPAEWSTDGQNLLWDAPYGSRSAPLVMGHRVYLINRAGEGEGTQERVMALDLNSGKRLWEHRFNVFLTDIVALRVGWANLAADPETGHLYAHGVQGLLYCFDPEGKTIWSRSLTEEFGRISGYGGRTHTPTVVGDLVLISFLNSSWGPQGKALHRFLALDKRTGEVRWWSEPSGKPLDTTYSVPVSARVDNRLTLFTGLADGAIVAMDPATGERLWSFPLSKRGINSSVVVANDLVFACHSEENHDSTRMGRVVALDARTGKETWRIDGLACGYASPVYAKGLLYVPHNKANLSCVEAGTGKILWEFNYGNEAKGSPVYADGKIFVGEVGGAYHVLQVSREGCVPLSTVNFKNPDGSPDEVFATPVIADGRVLLPTISHLYCIGLDLKPVAQETVYREAGKSANTAKLSTLRHLQLVPAETWAKPGDRVALQLIGTDTEHRKQLLTAESSTKASFSLSGLSGKIEGNHFVVPDDTGMEAGTIQATMEGLSPSARMRVVPPLPYREDFEGRTAGLPPPGWITSKLKAQVVDYEGGKVLKKLADKPAPPFARLRCYMMPPIDTGYTVRSDMMGVSKKNRFLPDLGLINSRYLLILTGSSEPTRKLRLVSWSPIPRIQKDVEFPWEPDTWYSVKLSVDLRDGKGLVRAKVWPQGTPEPETWTSEMTDPYPNPAGSPGLYAYSVGITSKSKGTEVLFDNVEVKQND